jgi:hypothetical protein
MAYVVAAALAGAILSPAAAAPAKKAEPAEILQKAAQAMVDGATSASAQSKQTQDPDQGDDNAAEKAILTVCTKNTPAARRSAICNGQVSPN